MRVSYVSSALVCVSSQLCFAHQYAPCVRVREEARFKGSRVLPLLIEAALHPEAAQYVHLLHNMSFPRPTIPLIGSFSSLINSVRPASGPQKAPLVFLIDQKPLTSLACSSGAEVSLKWASEHKAGILLTN